LGQHFGRECKIVHECRHMHPPPGYRQGARGVHSEGHGVKDIPPPSQSSHPTPTPRDRRSLAASTNRWEKSTPTTAPQRRASSKEERPTAHPTSSARRAARQHPAGAPNQGFGEIHAGCGNEHWFCFCAKAGGVWNPTEENTEFQKDCREGKTDLSFVDTAVQTNEIVEYVLENDREKRWRA